MKKKKKGSALVLVLMIFTILSILGISIGALAISTYKMRILKSNVKTGFYASEAGVDEAYGIIGKHIDAAIKYGNIKVNKFMQDLNENLGKAIQAKKNISILDKLGKVEEKKKAEKEYKEKDYEKYEKYINEDFTINQDAIKKDQNIKFKKAYVKFVEGEGNAKELVSKLNNPDSYKFKLKNNENKKPNIDAKVDGKLGILNIDYHLEKIQRLLTVNISSSFRYKGVEKRLKADYDIWVPSYKDSYYIEENYIRIAKNPVWTKAIAVDGDMNVNSSINIEGDMFIKGKEEGTKNHGIIINVPGIHRFNGQIVTGKNFNVLSKDSRCYIEKAVFSKNLLLNESANRSSVVIKESVYTKDDLEINAAKSGVSIKGSYYGLSNGSKSVTSDESSSININAIKGDGTLDCSLNIDGDSIIMGTSYVNLIDLQGEKYQTGESVSIKGNYRAYMNPLEGVPLDSKKGTFTEKDKLGFSPYYKTKDKKPNEEVDPFIEFISRYNQDPLTVIDKSNYFKSYHDKYGEDGKLKKIKIPKGSIHIGSIFTDEGVESSNYSIDVEDEIKLRNHEFNEMVYNMGQPLDSKVECNEKFLKTVGTQLNTKLIDKHIDEDEEKGIYNCGEYGTILLKKGEYTLSPNIKKGIVIVDGDVNVSSKVDFTGTIIATGNINIRDDAKIKYDENTVKVLVASRYDVLNEIFINDLEEEYGVQLDPKIGIAKGVKSATKKDRLIKMRNWTILK